jgi:hypothetical protein
MSPTPDPDAVEAARLRAAHDVLDERPSPAARQAVLRAAAESARGAPVKEAPGTPRQRPARSWFGWRPAAAAATAAVGVLAVGIAIHIEREAPTETSSEMPAPAAPVAPPARAAPAAPAAPAASAPSYNAAPAPAREEAPPPKKKAFAPATRAQAPVMQAPAGETAGGTAGETTARQAIPRAATPLAKTLSRGQAVAPQLQDSSERLRAPASAQEWLRRIIELRRAARHAEADEELTRFRATFPNVQVPEEALR